MASATGLRHALQALSEAEFRERFGTEAACRAALFELRWREGFTCPVCGHHGFCTLRTRKLLQCNRCKRQVRLTAGTVFQDTIGSKAANPVPQGREPTAREGCR